MKLSQIKPNPKNPRLIKDDKFEQLVKSLKDFPQMMKLRPIIIDENNIIQGGNMRFKALKALGYKDIPDEWVKQAKDLTPEQWREFVIKDNLAYGEMNWDMILSDWDQELLQEWVVFIAIYLRWVLDLSLRSTRFDLEIWQMTRPNIYCVEW